MKLRYLVVASIVAYLLACTNDANATTCKNGAKDYPKCTKPVEPTPAPVAQPTPAPAPTVVVVPAPAAAAPAPVTAQLAAELTPSQVATLRQQAAAEAAAKAAAEAAAKAAAEAQAAGGSAALQQTDASQTLVKGSYSLGLNITPATTPAMAAVTCPTPEITQETQFGAIIGSLGRGSSKTSSADCVVLTVTARMKCRPRTVALAENALLAKHLPGFKPAEIPVGVKDFAEDCDKPTPPPVAKVEQPAPPPVAKVEPPAPQRVRLAADALFDFDKAVLKPEGKLMLDALAATLQGEGANVVIVGHTDSRGSDAYNDRLSMQRANAVRAHLMLAGIDGLRMVALGKGKREPTCTENTETCHATNRRVDVKITVAAASPKLAALAKD